MPSMLALFAGLPSDILGPFISRLKQGHGSLYVLETLPLASAYTAQYAEDLHGMVASGLRKIVTEDSQGLAQRKTGWEAHPRGKRCGNGTFPRP